MPKRPIVESGVCDHASERECPHYNSEVELEKELEFYKALHNAGAYSRLAAAAKERLDEYVDKYKKLREANHAVQ